MITPNEMVAYLIFGFALLVALVGWITSSISGRQTDQLIVEEEVRFDNINAEQADRLGKATGLGCGGAILMMAAAGLLLYGLSVMGLPNP